MRLKNKIILITASTRGIGLACVKACAKEGAVCYMAARNLDAADRIANELNQQGYRVKSVYNDAGKPESFLTMIEDVVQAEGRLDVLVNNFGTSDPRKDLDFLHTEISDYLDIVTLNLRSVYMASQAAVKHMSKQGGGSIINISSVGGLVPDISQVAYGTSKAAINYLTKLIAVHEASHNIRCNAVLPGMTATEAVENNLSEEFRNLFLRHIPLKEWDCLKKLLLQLYILPPMNQPIPPDKFLQFPAVSDLPPPFTEIWLIKCSEDKKGTNQCPFVEGLRHQPCLPRAATEYRCILHSRLYSCF